MLLFSIFFQIFYSLELSIYVLPLVFLEGEDLDVTFFLLLIENLVTLPFSHH